ncbi:hypothetical protein T4D_15189 [Trichinella pseudospiralis]|uniref:Uncharacterized protein n=1 Tax=Trichinella pseudospiralis TaxID=6337 RepID=A0A0V1F6S8_TRIPS|nr:hypothetical protein T4D_12149 [Trichinella pseudospiralis]KRY81281.1 hypothetical protein T4D_2534 [Trichinella pseudospiralis]KRY81780.1 hypothetical protein T4D_15788 [Trichinella pseudospiralis]KRY82098.1 hypothetical protein T4D_15189 [Trichinella pseudospiralis]
MRREAEGPSFPLSSATPITSKSQNRLRSSSLYFFSIFTRSVMHLPSPSSTGMLPDKIHPNGEITASGKASPPTILSLNSKRL